MKYFITIRQDMKHKTVVTLAIVMALMVTAAAAQTKRVPMDLDISSDLPKDKATTAASMNLAQMKGAALESTIDPAAYFVGPSDQFAVNIWLATPISFLLTVSPEGTLIVPTVGEVRVADITLARAKEKILAEIRKKYLGGEPTVTLMTPRPLVVMVTGHVLNPGGYVLAGYNRADRAIEEAMRPDRNQIRGAGELAFKEGSKRNIRVTHKDGSQSRVDIPKFLSTREDRWNPYLREGDVIVVPRYDAAKSVVAVYGEVNVPGQFEYVEGDSVKDLLRIAYGFTPQAKTDSIELSRMDRNGDLEKSVYFDGNALLAGRQPDILVESGDRVVVRARPDYRADYHITIEGEVLYPGKYPISKNTTRLSEVIAKAGGVSEFASLQNAELLRNVLERKNPDLERLRSIHGGVPVEDTSYYDLESALRMQREIVNVDFERLFARKDSSADVIVQDFDYIIVPSRMKTVYVFGQVVSPGHITWVSGENLTYYLRKSSGVTDRAREGDIKIIKAKTKQWLSPKETQIEEGDYIWVPKEIERSFAYYMTVIGQTAAIVSAAVTVAILIVQLKK